MFWCLNLRTKLSINGSGLIRPPKELEIDLIIYPSVNSQQHLSSWPILFVLNMQLLDRIRRQEREFYTWEQIFLGAGLNGCQSKKEGHCTDVSEGQVSPHLAPQTSLFLFHTHFSHPIKPSPSHFHLHSLSNKKHVIQYENLKITCHCSNLG